MYKKILNNIGLSIKCSLVIFLMFSLTGMISAFLLSSIIKMGLLPESFIEDRRVIPLITLIASTIIGTIIFICGGNFTLKAFEKFIEASNQLAAGNFSARVYIKGPPEFRKLAKNFNHMAEELDNIEVLRSDFINHFSHEFKTPIVSIKGFAELLKCGDLSVEEREEYLDIVIEESSRLSVLATNVLELTKIEKQNIVTHKQHFNVGEQIRQCILLVDKKLADKEISLNLKIRDDTIFGNKEMMSQVWINLLDNAIKFNKYRGSIDITMSYQDKYVEIEMIDTGCGISNMALPRIFDKFYQSDPSHTTKGNGLGLAMVKRIIELHEGEIMCESELGEKTLFRILLPTKE